MSEYPEEILPEIDEPEGTVDHPDEIDDEEAERGRLAYLAVNDLDDEDAGVAYGE